MMFKKFFEARKKKLAVAHAELADTLEKRDEALRQLLELPARLAAQQHAESEAHKRIMEAKSRELAEAREKFVQLHDELRKTESEAHKKIMEAGSRKRAEIEGKIAQIRDELRARGCADS